MTRRELLLGASAATAALWARTHWDRSRVAAITDEIGATADKAADFAHDNGLQFVEVRNQPGSNREYATGREADMQAAATHLANEGIKVSVVNASLLKSTVDGYMDDLRKALHCAQVMDCAHITVFTGARADDPAGMLPRIADALAEMAAEAEKQKVSLLVENDPATNVATCAEIAALLKLVPSKSVGINWKPAFEDYALLPRKRILNVRVPAASLTPGKPVSANWKSILTALDKDGYTGKITLETGIAGAASIALARDSLDQLMHIVREVS